MSVLVDHMKACENSLLATSKIPANSGHTLHKGTPRETFIKNFLESHLPPVLGIGTGELIDSLSKSNEARNQFDLVLFRKTFPKLNFGGDIDAFLIESVVGTVEVKSVLDREGVVQSVKAARRAKALQPSLTGGFTSGYIPPKVLNYIVAYDGPVRMTTVVDWIRHAHCQESIESQDLPLGEGRQSTPSPSVDGIFVLGRGFVTFDNAPLGFLNGSIRSQNPSMKWVYVEAGCGALLMFFTLLTFSSLGVSGMSLNPTPYLQGFRPENMGISS